MDSENNGTILTVANDQRVGAIGKTGMGKTFLMERLLSQQPRVIVVDSKHRVQFPRYSLTYHADATFNEDARRVIYRHDADGVPDWWWERAMRHLSDLGGGVIYCDELPIITSASYAPRGLKNVLRIGRELGVGLWWAAQEAVGVSNTVIRQTDVLCLFFNHGASDRDKLSGIVGDMAETTKDLASYEFVVYHSSGTYDVSEIPIYKARA